MKARVSVLLPVFDAATTLATCLRSLTRQRLQDWQCVLIDDGSTDGSRAIARTWAARDDRIRVIETPHRGLVAALAGGLEACEAPIVARMDADDWMHRERLRLQVETLERDPTLAALGTHVRLFPRVARRASEERALPGEDGRARTGRFAYEAWLNAITTHEDVARNALVECPIAHPSLAIRRSVLERIPYRDFEGPEDYDLVLRLLEAGEPVGVLPKRLLGWRDAEERLSRQDPRYDLARFTDCKAAHLARTLLRDRRDYVLWGYGKTGRMLAAALHRHDRTPSCIVDVHPRRIGQRIRGAPVVAPEALVELDRTPVVASVAGAGPRREIRSFLGSIGYLELRDFVCAA